MTVEIDELEVRRTAHALAAFWGDARAEEYALARRLSWQDRGEAEEAAKWLRIAELVRRLGRAPTDEARRA